MGMAGERSQKISLGSGQDKRATNLITDGLIKGQWVLLQNLLAAALLALPIYNRDDMTEQPLLHHVMGLPIAQLSYLGFCWLLKACQELLDWLHLSPHQLDNYTPQRPVRSRRALALYTYTLHAGLLVCTQSLSLQILVPIP